MCDGVNYTANCTDDSWIWENYQDAGKCPGMGCDGTPGGSATVQWYYVDSDDDGLGLVNAGIYCLADVESANPAVVLNGDDFDDSCACTSSEGNTFAACYDCEGNCISDGAFFADQSGLTNVCTSVAAAGRKGCDVCDVCNGPGYTWYTDCLLYTSPSPRD